MAHRVMYVELKSGYSGEDGPARIGRVRFSKTGRTLYYRGLRLQTLRGGGLMTANYIDVGTGDEYWVSGVKRNGQDRHRFGRGPVEIDADARDEYLQIIGR
jgi:hypothetical protein